MTTAFNATSRSHSWGRSQAETFGVKLRKKCPAVVLTQECVFAAWYRDGDLGSVPGSGRSPGGEHGNGYPLQYSCLENPMDRGAWWIPAHGIAESDTTE